MLEAWSTFKLLASVRPNAVVGRAHLDEKFVVDAGADARAEEHEKRARETEQVVRRTSTSDELVAMHGRALTGTAGRARLHYLVNLIVFLRRTAS